MGLMGGMAALRSGRGGDWGSRGAEFLSSWSCGSESGSVGGSSTRATRHRLFRRTGETG